MKNLNFKGIRLSECCMRKLSQMIWTLDGGHLQATSGSKSATHHNHILREDTRVGHRKIAMRFARQPEGQILIHGQ
jgi:hypothetical protein